MEMTVNYCKMIGTLQTNNRSVDKYISPFIVKLMRTQILIKKNKYIFLMAIIRLTIAQILLQNNKKSKAKTNVYLDQKKTTFTWTQLNT